MAACGNIDGDLGIAPATPSLAFTEEDEKRSDALARERCKLQAMRILNSAVVASRNQGILEMIKSTSSKRQEGGAGRSRRGSKFVKQFEQNGKSSEAKILADFGCCDRLATAIVFPPLPVSKDFDIAIVLTNRASL